MSRLNRIGAGWSVLATLGAVGLISSLAQSQQPVAGAASAAVSSTPPPVPAASSSVPGAAQAVPAASQAAPVQPPQIPAPAHSAPPPAASSGQGPITPRACCAGFQARVCCEFVEVGSGCRRGAHEALSRLAATGRR